ncbi:holin (3TMs family) [Nitrospirillum amazonense]|uniref:Holin (3TMs family) n=1 Tax=Nitrospirillum amazonense TaxID=28077 RepID=A0A560FGF8_9PROT|nr:3TM-type holin [Nitrospirillum amazonense]TWB20690.1 holin (3TMs family) [Nitrospirillum amazonense]
MGILQDILSPASGVIGPVVTKLLNFIPDPTARAQAEAAAYKEAADRIQQLDLAQLEVNRAEAGNNSVFVAGWRPFIGWVCGAALAYQYIAMPLLVWVAGLAAGHAVIQPPKLDDQLTTILLGMLGLGGLRTLEKVKGVK